MNMESYALTRRKENVYVAIFSWQWYEPDAHCAMHISTHPTDTLAYTLQAMIFTYMQTLMVKHSTLMHTYV